jgi:hypothetical protein
MLPKSLEGVEPVLAKLADSAGLRICRSDLHVPGPESRKAQSSAVLCLELAPKAIEGTPVIGQPFRSPLVSVAFMECNTNDEATIEREFNRACRDLLYLILTKTKPALIPELGAA